MVDQGWRTDDSHEHTRAILWTHSCTQQRITVCTIQQQRVGCSRSIFLCSTDCYSHRNNRVSSGSLSRHAFGRMAVHQGLCRVQYLHDAVSCGRARVPRAAFARPLGHLAVVARRTGSECEGSGGRGGTAEKMSCSVKYLMLFCVEIQNQCWV